MCRHQCQRGRGVGGEGAGRPGTCQHRPRRKHTRDCLTTAVVPLWPLWLTKHHCHTTLRGRSRAEKPRPRKCSVQAGGPSPLTPGPSPLPGARGVMRDFHCCSKTQNPPLAPNGGEGSGVRGKNTLKHHTAARRKAPRGCHANQPLTSVNSVASVVKKTRLTRNSPDRTRAKARAT